MQFSACLLETGTPGFVPCSACRSGSPPSLPGGSLAAVEVNLNVLPRRPEWSHGVERLRPLSLFVNKCHPAIEFVSARYGLLPPSGSHGLQSIELHDV